MRKTKEPTTTAGIYASNYCIRTRIHSAGRCVRLLLRAYDGSRARAAPRMSVMGKEPIYG